MRLVLGVLVELVAMVRVHLLMLVVACRYRGGLGRRACCLLVYLVILGLRLVLGVLVVVVVMVLVHLLMLVVACRYRGGLGRRACCLLVTQCASICDVWPVVESTVVSSTIF